MLRKRVSSCYVFILFVVRYRTLQRKVRTLGVIKKVSLRTSLCLHLTLSASQTSLS
jgi:hypothetical protein